MVKKMLKYKGYIGKVEYDDEEKILCGEVINTKDVITFQGDSASEIEQAFHDSVDDYLEWCKADGVEPEKPYSGTLTLRLTPELDSQTAAMAKMKHLSINKFIEQTLSRAAAALL